MIWPRVMSYPIVDFTIRVAGAFSTELPYCPIGAMLVVEKFHEGIGGVAVGALWVGRGGSGSSDDLVLVSQDTQRVGGDGVL